MLSFLAKFKFMQNLGGFQHPAHHHLGPLGLVPEVGVQAGQEARRRLRGRQEDHR